MSAGHSAPTLPTATRAAASQVGIRARERAIPAESPSHAEAQWHEDSPYSLTVAGAAPDLPVRSSPASRFTRRPCGRQTPERRVSLPAIRATVNAGLLRRRPCKAIFLFLTVSRCACTMRGVRCRIAMQSD
jgi:hypothetical protein